MGKLIVLSGPSGVGKSTLCKKLSQKKGFHLSVSVTTRPPRPGEKKEEKVPTTDLGKQWQDFKENPQDWERIDNKKDPTGDSWRERWKNKRTGEEIGVHELTPDPKERHPHPFPVQKYFPIDDLF